MVNILIVEDDEQTQLLLSCLVKEVSNFVNVYTTDSVKGAKEILVNNIIDIFLLDIQLVDGMGLDLAIYIRSIDKYIMTPIVFITAVLTREFLAFKELHCYDYIIKPFNNDDIKRVLSTLLKYGVANPKNETLKINQKNIIYNFDLKDVIYLESSSKKIYIKTIEGKQEISSYTIKKLLKLLPNNFIQCHRAYVINKNYLKLIDKTNNLVVLKNTIDTVPIGEKFIYNLKGDY